ncbi:MAG: DUF4089 domain-containing protein [Proteobacteria bacterium]|nr:DUF4089 domain-containing protein [Pseudomonadota bacterium]
MPRKPQRPSRAGSKTQRQRALRKTAGRPSVAKSSSAANAGRQRKQQGQPKGRTASLAQREGKHADAARRSPALAAATSTTSKRRPRNPLIEAAARDLGIPLDARWIAAIGANREVIARHVASVHEFTLADDAEPAPLFEA